MPNSANVDQIHRRPVSPADEPFLRKLYATTREKEMAMVDWDEAQRKAFLSMQFQAQLSHYRQEYPCADHEIILYGDAPIGRLYVDEGETRIVLLDITLLPAWRNRGIGTHLLGELMAAAGNAGKPVHLHVWQQNDGAYRWYRRLGFVEVDRPHIYIRMVWYPTSPDDDVTGKSDDD